MRQIATRSLVNNVPTFGEFVPRLGMQYLLEKIWGIEESRDFLRIFHFFGMNPAPDLDGGEPGAQAWWEVPCANRIWNL